MPKRRRKKNNSVKSTNLWQKLGFVPIETCRYSNMTQINKYEFVIATDICYHKHTLKQGGIYKYNMMSNEWILFISYPKYIKFKQRTKPNINFNRKTSNLYVYGSWNNQKYLKTKSILIKINIYSHQFTLIPCPYSFNAKIETLSLFINSTYHVITGKGDRKYIILNDETNLFCKPIQINKEIRCLNGFIYNSLHHKCILFGGCYWNDNDIWSYHLQTKIWTKLENIQPNLPKMDKFSIVTTLDQRYLFIFGGNIGTYSRNTGGHRLIYMMEIDEKTLDNTNLRRLKLKCPSDGECEIFSAIIMPTNRRDTILLNGFLNQNAINNGIIIPNEIIDLISNFYSKEYIHLMQKDEMAPFHWEISVDHLIQNIAST